MRRGLGILQRSIYDLLIGHEKPELYVTAKHGLTTEELLEELEAQGTMQIEATRKVGMNAVRRACHGLARRGLIELEYVERNDEMRRLAVLWQVRR